MTDDRSPATDQLQAEIAALQQAISALAALPDIQQPLLAQLAEKEQQLAALQLQTGGVSMGQGTIIGRMGDAVAGDKIGGDQVLGDKHEHFYGPSHAPDTDTLLREYLGALSGACNRLSLADADSSDPTRAAVELAAVFTRLEVASTVRLTDEEVQARRKQRVVLEKERQRTALEAVASAPRLVLLGAPGGGKSTLVNFLGLCLARAWLGEAGWLAQLGDDWPHGALLPVRIVLREFAAWVAARPQSPTRGDVALLWAWLSEQHDKALVAALRREITAGRALLLLDGLDEVPADARGQPLAIVVQAIGSLAAATRPSRLLVTCRVLDYEQPQRKLPSWPVETLISFSEQLRQTFIGHWYAVLARLERPLNGDPAALRERLQTAVRERPELRRLAGNPLLLTMMTLLNAYEGRLPEERVKLYAKCVEFLLHRWRPRPGDAPLGAQLAIDGWSESDLGRLLDRLAFAAHERGVSGDSETGADLPRPVLIETARAFFAPYGADREYIRAQIFGNYISQYSNGVLQQHGPEIYRFPHRTFQEYLAARRLVADEDWADDEYEFVARALRRADAGPQWRSALLLALSQQAVVGNQVTPAGLLAEELLARHPPKSTAWCRDVTLAGEVLAEVGRERLVRLGPRRAAQVDVLAAALAEILDLRDATGQSVVPPGERVRAGTALGLLGDLRPGVTTLEPEWCIVPAGPFLLGSDDTSGEARYDGKPQRMVDLPDFRISRYPITNAQWRIFVHGGGYGERRWWSAAGWQAKEQLGLTQPALWDEPRFNGANQPIVGVSWYEATAFCRWLSSKLGYEIRLPSEAEWEKAARGTDGRGYPWGNTWDATRTNTSESGIGATAPVGCFPTGASPYGVLEMSGNVLEWTATPWTHDYKQNDGTIHETGDAERFVWRGGAWSDDLWDARCAYRYRTPPANRGNNLGVRVVATITPQD
jgi:formylglycine-generating enzyme required for sulfatase activity